MISESGSNTYPILITPCDESVDIVGNATFLVIFGCSVQEVFSNVHGYSTLGDLQRSGIPMRLQVWSNLVCFELPVSYISFNLCRVVGLRTFLKYGSRSLKPQPTFPYFITQSL